MDIHKICRVCLEEGTFTSIYSTEFAMLPCVMMMICAKIRVYKTDGLPAVICNNCIYRLGVAYHFKQECENSDIRLRQYLGLPDRGYGFCDAETNTEITASPLNEKQSHIYLDQGDSAEDDDQNCSVSTKSKRHPRYKRKAPEEHKKRGPKPLPKLPQTCYECNKSFKCQAQLRMHSRTHTGEKPFACRYCSRRFAQKYNLRVHERIHSGERPYQCEICSKQFSALGNFQAHQKIHTGVRDQVCPVCQKPFFNAGDLSKHMITHAGLKNHHCDMCGKAFSRQRDMQAHRRKLHASLSEERIEEDEGVSSLNARDPVLVSNNFLSNSSDKFKCPDCDKIFATAGNLGLHFRSHGSSNLLNFPLTQIPFPHAPLTHHYHPHALPLPLPPPHQATEGMHTHTQHLPLNATASSMSTIQTNHPETMSHLLPRPSSSHTLSAHALPPPPPPTSSGQSTIPVMHAPQRLHAY